MGTISSQGKLSRGAFWPGQVRYRMSSPSRILRMYYISTFLLGLVAIVPMSEWVKLNELGTRGAFGLILCWNVLCLMLLPLVIDWAERHYLKARFVAIQDIADHNPQLAEVIKTQCERLSISSLKFAVVENASEDLVSYGLWRSNPRLIVSSDMLKPENHEKAIPSVEAELARFIKRDDNTVIFLIMAGFQAMSLVFLVWLT